MKSQQSSLLFLIAIVSLIGIGIVLVKGLINNPPKISLGKVNVLGEATQNVNQLVASAFQNTKDVAQQKFDEAQKTLLIAVEKEASNLAKSQIDTIKYQICKDWGVIPATPSSSSSTKN